MFYFFKYILKESNLVVQIEWPGQSLYFPFSNRSNDEVKLHPAGAELEGYNVEVPRFIEIT